MASAYSATVDYPRDSDPRASRRSRDDVMSERSYRTGMSHVTQASYYSTAHTMKANPNSPEFRMQRFFDWVYDSKTSKFCGRSMLDWIFILLYYFLFYLALAGLFAACWGIFSYAIVMKDFPVRTGENSLLKMNPGLGIIPQPDHYTSLIAYRQSRRDSYRKYVDDLVAVTQFYELHGGGKSGSEATEKTELCVQKKARSNWDARTVCQFDLNVGGRCNILQEFGYDDGQPCVALKLNRIYGWLPDPMENTTHVQVKCEGVTDIDKDMLGQVCYHDDNDFDNDRRNQCKSDFGEFKSYYFPYLKQSNYMSPLVFVEFMQPKRNVIIMIQCTAYAKNIEVDRMRRQGSVRFELLID